MKNDCIFYFKPPSAKNDDVELESVIFWGRDKDRVLNYESYIDKLTVSDIQAAAKKLFDGKNEFTAVLYPEG